MLFKARLARNIRKFINGYVYELTGSQFYKLSDFTCSFEKKLNTGRSYEKVNHIYKYYDENNTEIGYLHFHPESGQIGIIRLDEEYRGIGLGTQMIKIVEDARKPFGNNLWVVSTPYHPFWEKQYKATWKDPANYRVTGSGFAFKIKPIN